jgi:hypothetical protein
MFAQFGNAQQSDSFESLWEQVEKLGNGTFQLVKRVYSSTNVSKPLEGFFLRMMLETRQQLQI